MLRYAGETLGGTRAKRCVPTFSKTKQSTEAYDEDSTTCTKNYDGKAKRRCMLFLHVCLEHGAICSFHLTTAEGRKDMVLPIYRFWDELPRLLVYDFGCG